MAGTVKLSEVKPNKTLKPGDTYGIVNEKKWVKCNNCVIFCRHFGVSGMNFDEGTVSTNGLCHHEGHCINGCPVKAITRYQLADDGETMNEVEPVGF